MPQVTEASRRARGIRRLVLRVPTEYVARLDRLCAESGYSRSEQVIALIDWETQELHGLKGALLDAAQAKRKKGK